VEKEYINEVDNTVVPEIGLNELNEPNEVSERRQLI